MIFGKTRSDLKYLLDSLFYLAGSWAPYIHVILSYVVSITWYINQPLVRLLLCIINLQLVWYHLHRLILHNDLIQFLVGMFGFKLEYISPYSISTVSKWHTFPIVDLVLGCSIRDTTERQGRSLELPSLLLKVVSVDKDNEDTPIYTATLNKWCQVYMRNILPHRALKNLFSVDMDGIWKIKCFL